MAHDDNPGRGRGNNQRDDIRPGDMVYITSPDLERTYRSDTYIVAKVKSSQSPYWALRSTRTGILTIVDTPVAFNVVTE